MKNINKFSLAALFFFWNVYLLLLLRSGTIALIAASHQVNLFFCTSLQKKPMLLDASQSNIHVSNKFHFSISTEQIFFERTLPWFLASPHVSPGCFFLVSHWGSWHWFIIIQCISERGSMRRTQRHQFVWASCPIFSVDYTWFSSVLLLSSMSFLASSFVESFSSDSSYNSY